jgi:multidrug resistance efflux pump
VADNEQENIINRIRQRASEATAGVRASLSERAEGILRGSRRRLVLIGAGIVLGIGLILAIGINLAGEDGGLDQLWVDLQLKEPALGDGLLVSGFIEAEEVNLAAEIGGRVEDLSFDEGEEVEAGDVLVRLGSGTLEAEAEAAHALLDIAQADQTILETGARDEAVAQAEAGLKAAQAARDGAYAAWQDAMALRDNPQEINVQLAEAYTQYTIAQGQSNAAQARYDEAARVQWLYANTPGAVDLYLGRGNNPNVAPNERTAGDVAWQMQGSRDTAQAVLTGASSTLAAFYDLRDNPQALEAQVINAEAQYRAAEARLMEAQAGLDLVLTGASDEELAGAQSSVAQAQAAVEQLETQLAKLTIAAPAGGVVLDQTVLEGELAVPGVTLVTLADLDEVKLTVFVPEDQLDKVRIGQRVRVSVDSFPERTFRGEVATIANEAEFTPRSVVTREERVSLVFAVEIRLPNADHALKPGMPADAALGS